MSVKRTMHKTLGMELPRLGFGTMRLPVKDSKIDRELADVMVDDAIKHGVNYFDTAYPYHNGESEPYIGESLARYPRDSFLLASKMPTWMFDGTTETVDRIFHEQRNRCRVEYFDFYLIHALSADRVAAMKKCGAYEYLSDMKKQGKIHKLGFSFHGDHDCFRLLLEEFQWDFVQIQINYLDAVKQEAGKLYDMLCEKGIPCFVMEPVRGGFLANPPEEALRVLKEQNETASAASWAMRWCIAKENMPVILSGMSSMEQLKDNIATFGENAPDQLTAGEQAAIQKARDIILSIKTVPCTACRYCMDCPFGVDIPHNFTAYNDYMLFKNDFTAGNEWKWLEENKKDAGKCTLCGACSPQCPQGISIPDRLEDARKVLSKIGS